MWIAIAVVSVIIAVAVIVGRLALTRQRTPHPDDRGRQHQVPDTDG